MTLQHLTTGGKDLMTRFLVRIRRSLAIAALAAACFPTALLADTVWTRLGNNNPVATEGTIVQIAEGRLQMQSRTGNNIDRPLEQVVKIKADGETAFNEAEEAYEQNKFEAAAGAYERAVTSTSKEWVRARSVSRLVLAADQSGQFHLQAAAFVQLAARDPAAAESKRPAIPTDKAVIAKALPSVERAFAARPNDLTRQFLGELLIAAERFDDVARLFPAGAAKEPSIIVLQASAAAKKGQYAQALQTIESNKTLINKPDQQLTALFTSAEAKAALAQNDPAKIQDAAIAYMRVVAHFGSHAEPNLRNDPRILESMWKAAAMLERAGQPAEAAALYAQIASDDRAKNKPIGIEAGKKAEALKKAK